MIEIKKLLRTRVYKKWGYQLLYYTVDGTRYGNIPDTEMCSAFTWPEFRYIGDSKTAYRLCKKRGIKPELIDPKPPVELQTEKRLDKRAKQLLGGVAYTLDSSICSIGFQENEQKWYGWSHRAMYGFGIDSRVKFGDCAYLPRDYDDWKKCLLEWYKDFKRTKVKSIQETSELFQVTISTEGQPDRVETHWKKDVVLGKGEWAATTLDEAKEMAIAFARDVS